ncbi:hypothetical protein JY783_19610, partial [Clostridioides difficile]|nr:hypothetical protein [Clostridioides difficile]
FKPNLSKRDPDIWRAFLQTQAYEQNHTAEPNRNKSRVVAFKLAVGAYSISQSHNPCLSGISMMRKK